MPKESEIEDDMSIDILRARRIFKEHGNFLRSIISLRIKDESDADDFYQELFLFFFWKSLPENVSSIKGLLYKIVLDKAKDFHRRKKNYKNRIEKYAEIVDDEELYGCSEDLHIKKEESEKMFVLIRGNLPAKEAQAVIFRYKYGYDNKKISEEMGITQKSVTRYISVGINKLKKLWA